MYFYPFRDIFYEKSNMQHFGLYAANMPQYAAAVVFLGALEYKSPFLVKNVLNINFQSI